MYVTELMDTHPLTVSANSAILDAIAYMADNLSSYLIIIDSNRSPIGIITERDVTRQFSKLLSHKQFREQRITDMMTHNPVCIRDNSPFEDALMLSRARQLRHLPVVNHLEQIVGIVTQSNLVDEYVRLIDRHSELEHSIEKLKLLSLQDALLGIGNRRAMEVDLAHTQALAHRHDKPYSVAMLDIDFFKLYNDHYGHQAGDKILKQVARTIEKTLRGGDRVFRYGGEEFLILIPDSTIESATICAQRVRDKLVSLALPHEKSSFGIITVSIGIATDHKSSWKTLVKQADDALYKAKHAGRDQIVVSDS